MVVSARSKSIEGPWENSPYNPIIRTPDGRSGGGRRGTRRSSRGPTASGGWCTTRTRTASTTWGGRRCSSRSSGRRTAGSARRASTRRSRSQAGPDAVPHGFAFSDDFSTNKMGIQWSFYKGTDTDRERYRHETEPRAEGAGPDAVRQLAALVRDRRSRVRVRGGSRCRPGPRPGAALLQQPAVRRARLLGENFIMHSYGTERRPPSRRTVGRGCTSACATTGTS
jgi:xylan 1,4-beta-xylosidase